MDSEFKNMMVGGPQSPPPKRYTDFESSMLLRSTYISKLDFLLHNIIKVFLTIINVLFFISFLPTSSPPKQLPLFRLFSKNNPNYFSINFYSRVLSKSFLQSPPTQKINPLAFWSFCLVLCLFPHNPVSTFEFSSSLNFEFISPSSFTQNTFLHVPKHPYFYVLLIPSFSYFP